jgi:cell division septum initiation protein DivIVA
MSDDYKALVAENEQLKARVIQLDGVARSLTSQLANERYENVDLRQQIIKARKPQRALDPNAASAFDRPYDGR